MADENKKLTPSEAGKKLKEILDDILATGDWDSSLFLKTSALRLKALKDRVEKIYCSVEAGDETADSNTESRTEPLTGSSRVFILVYQVEGADLLGWNRTIKTLVEYCVTRPTYNNEEHAREFIRSKVANIERNGYIIANVKDDAFYHVEQQVDALGHQLFALKENAIKLENIIEFIHANKKRYAVRDEGLVFLGEI